MQANPPCDSCDGACCKAGAHGWPHSTVAHPYVDGRCPNLTADNRCAIYDTRPNNCREFDCRTDKSFKRAMGAGPWSEACTKTS